VGGSSNADEPPEAVDARFRAGLSRGSSRQGRFERWLRRAIRAWCRVCGWRLEVTFVAPLPAADGRPPGAGCVVAGAPHRAWVEPFLLAAAWPDDAARLVWMGEVHTMTASWWRRALFPRLGMIPITGRTGAPREYAELVAASLARGTALAIFPEKGPPSAPDRTRRISSGFAYLALRAGAPVIPVVMGGTHRIVRGSSFTVDFLAPIEVGPAIRDPFTPGHRPGVDRLVARYRQVVEEVLPARTALADARRPRRERWRWLATLLR
jgi:1-acyl-sn-glycerol-3-phosphate acyltransferase